MAVALVEASPDLDIKDVLCEWMQECIDNGMPDKEAGARVLARFRAEGEIDALLDRFGAHWVNDTWHRYAVAPSRRSMWEVSRGPKPASIEPGGRRIDLTLLADEASVMETLWLVDGEWVQLGDMVKHQLRTLADKYMQLTENSQRKADFFDKLATDLPKDKLVRVVFSEEQLRAMLVELGA